MGRPPTTIQFRSNPWTGGGENLRHGIANYLSRNPTAQTDNAIYANTLWNEWFTIIIGPLRNKELNTDESTSRARRTATNHRQE